MRSEDDLRAAFAAKAAEAPRAEDVLAPIYRPSKPKQNWRPAGRVIGAVAAAAAAGTLIALPFIVGSNSQKSASSAGRAMASSSSAASTDKGKAAAGAQAEPTRAQPPSAADAHRNFTTAGRNCGAADLTLRLTWTKTGATAIGTLTATNRSSGDCDLLVKPQVQVDGQRTPAAGSNEARIAPRILRPGASAHSTITWTGWCGGWGRQTVRISWPGTATTVSALGPIPGKATCSVSAGERLTASWFGPLSEQPGPPRASGSPIHS